MTLHGTTSSFQNATLCAVRYKDGIFPIPTFFEAYIKFPGKQTGFVGIALSKDNGGTTACFLHYFYQGSDYATLLHCNYYSDTDHFDSKARAVTPGTWHKVRIEIDPATGTFTYYLDSQLVESYKPGGDFNTVKFTPRIFVTADSPTDVTGYLDDVRIGPVQP